MVGLAAGAPRPRVVRRAASAALAVLLFAACVPRPAGGYGQPRTEELTAGTGRFRLIYFPEDVQVAAQVRRAIEKAVPRIERWGGLRYPVTVTIHPTHEALEVAVDRRGYDWLHAWAKFQTVDLQSPRTWSFFGPSARELEELFTHELTHCAMYQQAGGEMTWMYKEIPRWFSEGLATVTAGQGAKYATLEDLHRFYVDTASGAGYGDPSRARPAVSIMAQPGDPVVDPDPIYQEQWRIVYGAGHRATEFLVARYGEERIVDLMRVMGTGLRFPAAFRQVIGISDAEFAADFRRYVIWQGWRRN